MSASVSSIEKEKHTSAHIEDGTDAASSFTEAEDRALTRKVDRRLLIILGAVYAISLIDRTNISVARVAGMAKELQLTVGERYSIIGLIFFIPYIIFELPSNILLRKIGTRNHLTTITVLWGAVMLGMGFVKTWEQLAACRVLLGLLESGFFPGCVFLISCWYTRYQTQKRIAVFYLTSMVITGFSQIIGYGITKLGGSYGIASWRWVFIVFGAATMGLGIIAFFTLVDFPDKATFLTTRETAHIINKINEDRGDAVADELTGSMAIKHLKDWRIWAYGLMYMSTTMPAYAFAFFLPVILAGGGYNLRLSLVLSAPPYVFAALYTYAVAYVSDKLRRRAIFIVLNSLVCMTGLFIMSFAGKIGPRYFGAFLAIGGCQSNVPALLAYQANNILTYSKRAVTSAVVIGFGGIGGIFATAVYREKDTPKYINGLGATIGCQGLILLLLVLLTVDFKKMNKRVDEGTAVIEGKPGFKYTL
ncbi:major facilitator superfamily domain-containing protein [Mycena rebaudengoi]|nr:major facilitator superfamily domain-containing protein [Mycena rebaudengoi]KAJ7277562.1 major facilitator superfamily domain-containing protein [Mycena rebaudengoi]